LGGNRCFASFEVEDSSRLAPNEIIEGGGARAALMRMLDALENVSQLIGAILMMLKEREKPAASRCAGGAGDGSGIAGGTMGGVGRLYGATNACEGMGCTVCVCYEAGARCRF
jgi:hypothetical protein